MPGPYAHITLIYELMRPGRLKSIFSPLSGFDTVLPDYLPYCTLGAVSPDYPNLAAATEWADAMHYTKSCGMITSGIRRVRGSKGAVREKQLAWLLGYCAHLATDVTIHPVVQAKVGVYAENQRHHRICEMNQDSFIYHRMDRGEIGESDYFAQAIAECSCSNDPSQLDSDIATLWEGMLRDVHPQLYAARQPDSASWHREYIALLAKNRVSEIKLFPLGDVISTKMDLAYPPYNSIDRQYIDRQEIPSKTPQWLHYDDIFDHAADNVAAIWRLVERAVCNGQDSNLPTFGDWNLDNGLDEFGRLVFWDQV